MQTINGLLDYGRDPRQLIRDLIGYFRNLLLFKVGAGQDELVEATQEEKQVFSRQAASFSPEQLMAGIELLAATEGEIRWDAQPRVSLEVMAIKLLLELARPEKREQQALQTQEPPLEVIPARPRSGSPESGKNPS